MRCRQLLISDLQPTGMANPSQRPLDHLADAAQPAAVGRPRPREVVLDPSLAEPAPVRWRAVGAVAVGVHGPAPRPTAAPPAPPGIEKVTSTISLDACIWQR